MVNIYHGSLPRFIASFAVSMLRSPRRSIRQLLRRDATDAPEAARHFRMIESLVAEGRLDAATAYTVGVAEDALDRRDAQMLSLISRPLERLEQYGLQARCLRESRRIQRPLEKEWDGQTLDGTLLIDFRYRNLALPIRSARLIGLAAANAKRCRVLAESRLLPLFRRTFPTVEAGLHETSEEDAFRDADAVATLPDILFFFARDADSIRSSFVPLRPDDAVMNALRAQYRASEGGPLIGVSWGSSNLAKDAPKFGDWAELLSRPAARFVSLQYGNVEPAVRKFSRWAGGRFIVDRSVDQLVDMDRFAAQVASLDAVVSTSNTIAHLAGALGVPSVVILDDHFYQFWPFTGALTPWNPKTVLVRKQGRDWPTVMREANGALATLLSTRASESRLTRRSKQTSGGVEARNQRDQ